VHELWKNLRVLVALGGNLGVQKRSVRREVWKQVTLDQVLMVQPLQPSHHQKVRASTKLKLSFNRLKNDLNYELTISVRGFHSTLRDFEEECRK